MAGFWDSSDATLEDVEQWDPQPDRVATNPGGMYGGDLPQGYTLAEVQDYLARNPGARDDQVMAALNDRVPGHGLDGSGEGGFSAGTFTQLAPQSIQPFTAQFSAPTMQQAEQSPGFQFRLGEGLKALQRSAAARGTLLTGGTLKSLTDYAQGSASQEYDKVYGRAMGEYGQQFGIHQWNEGSRFDSQRQNRADDYGMFANDRGFNFGVFTDARNDRRRVEDDWYNRRFRLADYGYGAAQEPQT